MSIDEKLSEFLINEVEPKLERKKIKKEHRRVRELLREKLVGKITRDFLMGSYKRHVLIKRLSKEDKYDVDIMIIFDKDEYGLSDLVDLKNETLSVCEQIKQEIPEIVEVRNQTKSVGLVYDENFRIDIVPAVEAGDKGKYKIYIFDNKKQLEVESDPELHNTVLSEANVQNNYLLVPLIKLIKRWKDENCIDKIKSFHLQQLAIQIFDGKDTVINGPLEGLGIFFSTAYELTFNNVPIVDPANFDNDISDYLDKDFSRASIAEKFQEAGDNIKEIIELVKNDEKAALKVLGRLFSYFRSEEDKELSGQISSILNRKEYASPWIDE